MALLIPFLTGAILFSSASPEYEANLMNEIYDCNKYLKIPIDTLWKMRVRDRRFMIARHNKDTKIEAAQYQGEEKTTTNIDAYTDLTISNAKNRNKR